MECLSIQVVDSIEEDIMQNTELLLACKAVVFKHKFLQERFLKDCVNKPYNTGTASRFSLLNNSRKSKIKFEAEDRIRKFYENVRPQPRTSIPNRRIYSS